MTNFLKDGGVLLGFSPFLSSAWSWKIWIFERHYLKKREVYGHKNRNNVVFQSCGLLKKNRYTDMGESANNKNNGNYSYTKKCKKKIKSAKREYRIKAWKNMWG